LVDESLDVQPNVSTRISSRERTVWLHAETLVNHFHHISSMEEAVWLHAETLPEKEEAWK
jgi:hypothetical protein